MGEVLEDYSLRKKSRKKGSLKKVAVLGCGIVGQEVTRLISQIGIDVIFVDITEKRVREIYSELDKQIDDLIDGWGLTHSEKRAILSRIKGTTNMEQIKDCDLVIETINFKTKGTNIELRKDIFRKIESVVSKETVIASNNATLMITDLAEVLEYPERAIGLHFLHPAASVDIVEITRGIDTNQATYDFTCKFAKMLNKKVINLDESPGNISTRLIVTLINEACEILMEGVASVPAIDETMKLGFGLRFGPLEMADKIGLDKVLKWMDNLYMEYGMQNFKASPILKKLVRANYLGCKSGNGFYKYENGKATTHSITCTEFR